MWHLDNKKPGEEILRTTCSHTYVLLKPLLQSTAIIVLVIASFIYVPTDFPKMWILIIGVPIALAIFGYAFFLWYYDLFILTNRRVFDIDRHSIFSYTVIEARLDSIQEVSYKIENPIQNILNFGNVTIHTSGPKQSNIVLENVANPQNIQQEINEARDQCKIKNQKSNC